MLNCESPATSPHETDLIKGVVTAVSELNCSQDCHKRFMNVQDEKKK